MDDHTARLLAGSVERAYGSLSDEERRRVNPLLERTADSLEDAATAERLLVLTGAVVLTETEALVAAAVNAHGGQLMRTPEVRALPEVQAILAAPEAARRACVLQLATSRGPYWPFPLLNVISRKRLGFTADDLAVLFSVEVERPESRYRSTPTPWSIYWEAIRILAGQIAQSFVELAPAEQERVRPLVERTATRTYDELATALRKAVGTAEAKPASTSKATTWARVSELRSHRATSRQRRSPPPSSSSQRSRRAGGRRSAGSRRPGACRACSPRLAC